MELKWKKNGEKGGMYFGKKKGCAGEVIDQADPQTLGLLVLSVRGEGREKKGKPKCEGRKHLEMNTVTSWETSPRLNV